MAEDEINQNDADPFETSARVVGSVEKIFAADASTAPLDPQEPLGGTEGMVRPSQTSADVQELGRSAGNLEKPFTHDESLSFYHPPRQYTLGRRDSSKSNGCIPSVAFVLRSSLQITEESDDEFGSEGQDGDIAEYSFPCEDSKVNELISAMASLSLGTTSTVAHPTITPTPVRARVSHLFPARTSASADVAVFRLAVVDLSTIQYTMPMEIDEDAVYPKVAINDALHLQGMSEAVSMDGVVFHPDFNDMEMADTFVTIRKLLQVVLYHYYFR